MSPYTASLTITILVLILKSVLYLYKFVPEILILTEKSGV